MTLRALRRAVALAFALAVCVADYWLTRIRIGLSGRGFGLTDRAQWLHRACRRVLRAFGIRLTVCGPRRYMALLSRITSAIWTS